jgi:hypothetical protein
MYCIRGHWFISLKNSGNDILMMYSYTAKFDISSNFDSRDLAFINVNLNYIRKLKVFWFFFYCNLEFVAKRPHPLYCVMSVSL